MDPSEPHIRVLLDAIKDSYGVSTATGLLQPTILGGLTNLWARCRRTMSDLVTEGELRGCFGPLSPELIPALISFGFLTAEEEGQWRVRGAETLLRVARQKVEAGKARAATAGRGTDGRVLPNHPKPPKKPSGRPADRQRESSGPPAGVQRTTHPPTHPSTSTPSTTTTELPEVVVVGGWGQFQEVRIKAGYGLESRRTAGFKDWLQAALLAHALVDLLRGYEFFLHDSSIKAPTHPTAVFIRDGVWSTRIPPPLPPLSAPAAPPPEAPAVHVGAAEIWGQVLAGLRADGKTYALDWLTKFVPCDLAGEELTLWGHDRFFLDWVEDHYGELLAHQLQQHRLFLVAPDAPRRPLIPPRRDEGETDG